MRRGKPGAAEKFGMNGLYYASNQWRAAASQAAASRSDLRVGRPGATVTATATGRRIICSFARIGRNQVKTVQHGRASAARRTVSRRYRLRPETLSPSSREEPRNMWQELLSRPLEGAYYRERTADLSKVVSAALGRELGGRDCTHAATFEGFTGAASRRSGWKCTAGSHWAPFYTDYGVTLQKRFIDHISAERLSQRLGQCSPRAAAVSAWGIRTCATRTTMAGRSRARSDALTSTEGNEFVYCAGFPANSHCLRQWAKV